MPFDGFGIKFKFTYRNADGFGTIQIRLGCAHMAHAATSIKIGILNIMWTESPFPYGKNAVLIGKKIQFNPVSLFLAAEIRVESMINSYFYDYP